jgi:hypothetical protein
MPDTSSLQLLAYPRQRCGRAASPALVLAASGMGLFGGCALVFTSIISPELAAAVLRNRPRSTAYESARPQGSRVPALKLILRALLALHARPSSFTAQPHALSPRNRLNMGESRTLMGDITSLLGEIPMHSSLPTPIPNSECIADFD